jgi:hypothetical protein
MMWPPLVLLFAFALVVVHYVDVVLVGVAGFIMQRENGRKKKDLVYIWASESYPINMVQANGHVVY